MLETGIFSVACLLMDMGVVLADLFWGTAVSVWDHRLSFFEAPCYGAGGGELGGGG